MGEMIKVIKVEGSTLIVSLSDIHSLITICAGADVKLLAEDAVLLGQRKGGWTRGTHQLLRPGHPLGAANADTRLATGKFSPTILRQQSQATGPRLSQLP